MIKDANSKRNDFIRLSGPRIERAVDALRVLGNCGDRKNYLYTEDQAETIFKQIDEAVAEFKARYAPDAPIKRSKMAIAMEQLQQQVQELNQQIHELKGEQMVITNCEIVQ